MQVIPSHILDLEKNLEVKIKNIKGYFTAGRRCIWINNSTFLLETNRQLFLRCLSIATIVIPVFKLRQLSITQRKLNHLKLSISRINPFDCLSKELILKIQSLCNVNDQVSFSRCCKKNRDLYLSDLRLQNLYKIAKCFSTSAPISSVNVPHASCCNFDHERQEILVGQSIDYSNRGKDGVLVYDKKLQEKSKLSEGSFVSFTKSISQIVPTKEGNAVISSEYNENLVVYWDRKNNHATLIKMYEIFDPDVADVKIAYNSILKRIYLATKGVVDVYEEREFLGYPYIRSSGRFPTEKSLLTQPTFIEKINSPIQESIYWIKVDGELNKLMMITKNGKLIECDLTTKACLTIEDFSLAKGQYSRNYSAFYDEDNKWLIGKTEANAFIVWNARFKRIEAKINIPLESDYFKVMKALHYDPVKNWVFFFIEEKESSHWTAKLISGQMFKWDIKNQIIEKILLENPLSSIDSHVSEVKEIDYDSQCDVLVVNTGYRAIYAWDLKNGKLIPNTIAGNKFIWDKKTFTFISLNSYKSTVEVRYPN